MLFLPALALAIGIGLAELHQRFSQRKLWLKFAPSVVLLLAIGISLYRGRVYFFELSAVEEVRFNYGNNPFPEAIPIARYIQEHTKSTDRISILGSEPEILFYANRLSATGHIYTYWLMEPQPYARAMQHEFIQETERAVPEFVVFVPLNTSWLWSSRSITDLWEWIPQFLAAHYDRVGVINIESNRSSFSSKRTVGASRVFPAAAGASGMTISITRSWTNMRNRRSRLPRIFLSSAGATETGR